MLREDNKNLLSKINTIANKYIKILKEENKNILTKVNKIENSQNTPKKEFILMDENLTSLQRSIENSDNSTISSCNYENVNIFMNYNNHIESGYEVNNSEKGCSPLRMIIILIMILIIQILF